MTTWDWLVVSIYSLFMIFLGWRLGRTQKSVDDYYLGGRRIPWLPIGFSTMATQLGAISFISAPAFVALRPQGGMIWLGYELALPIAMVVLMAFFFPLYHARRIISVYAFLEERFDVSTRIAISFIFQVSRGLATGVAVYAAALVLAVTLGIPLTLTILLIGAVAVAYELMGGIRVDIISDTIQMVIILLGIVVTGIVGLRLIGGWGSLAADLDPARLTAIDFAGHGWGDGRDFGFWPLFLGGFFLYASYYGCDQSQVQRELSAHSLKECRYSLLFNGFLRFPVVLATCTVGLILGAFVQRNPAFLARLPSGGYDYLLPTFILEHIPPGLVGLIFIAIIAAAMSSLDSSINSLSAATLEDIAKRLRSRPLDPSRELRLSKLLTFGWGVFCVGFAFFVGDISPTVIESINKIGSAFYGPVFAVFFAAVFLRKAKPIAVLIGLGISVGTNLFLWLFVPSVSWLWWNAVGFGLAVFVIAAGSRFLQPGFPDSPLPIQIPSSPGWKIIYALLVFYALGLIVFLVLFPKLF